MSKLPTHIRFTDEELKIIAKLIDSYAKATSNIVADNGDMNISVISMAAFMFVRAYALQIGMHESQLLYDFESSLPVAMAWVNAVKEKEKLAAELAVNITNNSKLMN